MCSNITWLKSLATFMASQPASHHINLQEIDPPTLPAAQTLVPWVEGLKIVIYVHIGMTHMDISERDDMGKVLKSAIEVGQYSLTWMPSLKSSETVSLVFCELESPPISSLTHCTSTAPLSGPFSELPPPEVP